MVGPQPCLWSQACTCVWWVRARVGVGQAWAFQNHLVEGDERAALALGLGGRRRRGGGRVGQEQQEKTSHAFRPLRAPLRRRYGTGFFGEPRTSVRR